MSQYLDVAIGFVLLISVDFQQVLSKVENLVPILVLVAYYFSVICCYLHVKSKEQNDSSKKHVVEGKLYYYDNTK